MNTPVVSSNRLKLHSPFRLHGALQLLFAVVVAVLALDVWPGFHRNSQLIFSEAHQAHPHIDAVLVARMLVQALGFLVVLWFVLRNAFSGLQRLLSFFIPVGIPGELGQAAETSQKLFVQRVFGQFASRTSLADKAFVRLAPRMMYLTTPGMDLLRAASSWKVLLWCALAFVMVSFGRPQMDWPWGVLAVVVAAKAVYSIALVLLTPPEPDLQVTEDRQHFDNTGNPVNFFNHIEKIANDLRHETFPNRVYQRAEPGINNVQPGVTSTFHGGYLFETQPLPIARSGRIPALLLDGAALAAGIGAVAMLLFVPTAPPARVPPPWIVAWVLTAITMADYSGHFFARALDLLQTFRFESHLFWIDLKGSFSSSSIGIGDGRGGQFHAERRSIQSDTYVISYGAKIVTEANGRNALRAPRIIVNTDTGEMFTAAFARLLEGMPTYQDSTSALPTIQFERSGVKEILQANLAVTGAMSRAADQADLPPGPRPAGILPPPAASTEGNNGASPAPGADDAEMKVCPECGEKVRAVARKCRFCNYRFDTAPASPNPPEKPE